MLAQQVKKNIIDLLKEKDFDFDKNLVISNDCDIFLTSPNSVIKQEGIVSVYVENGELLRFCFFQNEQLFTGVLINLDKNIRDKILVTLSDINDPIEITETEEAQVVLFEISKTNYKLNRWDISKVKTLEEIENAIESKVHSTCFANTIRQKIANRFDGASVLEFHEQFNTAITKHNSDISQIEKDTTNCINKITSLLNEERIRTQGIATLEELRERVRLAEVVKDEPSELDESKNEPFSFSGFFQKISTATSNAVDRILITLDDDLHSDLSATNIITLKKEISKLELLESENEKMESEERLKLIKELEQEIDLLDRKKEDLKETMRLLKSTKQNNEYLYSQDKRKEKSFYLIIHLSSTGIPNASTDYQVMLEIKQKLEEYFLKFIQEEELNCSKLAILLGGGGSAYTYKLEQTVNFLYQDESNQVYCCVPPENIIQKDLELKKKNKKNTPVSQQKVSVQNNHSNNQSLQEHHQLSLKKIQEKKEQTDPLEMHEKPTHNNNPDQVNSFNNFHLEQELPAPNSNEHELSALLDQMNQVPENRIENDSIEIEKKPALGEIFDDEIHQIKNTLNNSLFAYSLFDYVVTPIVEERKRLVNELKIKLDVNVNSKTNTHENQVLCHRIRLLSGFLNEIGNKLEEAKNVDTKNQKNTQLQEIGNIFNILLKDQLEPNDFQNYSNNVYFEKNFPTAILNDSNQKLKALIEARDKVKLTLRQVAWGFLVALALPPVIAVAIPVALIGGIVESVNHLLHNKPILDSDVWTSRKFRLSKLIGDTREQCFGSTKTIRELHKIKNSLERGTERSCR